MQIYDTPRGPDLRELVPRGTPMFPLESYDEEFSKFVLGYVPWHWHDDLEWVVVYEGAVEVHCGDGVHLLHTGEGICINGGVLHLLRPAPEAAGRPCKIFNFVFHPSLLYGMPESVLGQKYVRPMLTGGMPDAIVLSPRVCWQADALAQIETAFHVYEQKNFGCEVAVLAALFQVWYLLLTHLPAAAAAHPHTLSDARMKTMFTFLQAHFSEPLSIARIAASADISESECFRCFRAILHTSPAAYLLDYRLRRAAELLAETGDSVTDICFACGFNSPSYFAKMFAQTLKTTPRAYRNALQKSQTAN